MKRPSTRKPKGPPEARCCQCCGCTDMRACIGGCFWVDQKTCSTCARIYFYGYLQGLEQLKKAFGTSAPLKTAVQAVDVLISRVSIEIARLDQDWPLTRESIREQIAEDARRHP
jgi:hypothetical protein